jgi:hypothetical protein
MPSSTAILAGLTTIANEWWTVAVFWHAYVALLLVAIAARLDCSVRLLGGLLVLPLLSVSALAWASGNPFNGVIFAGLSYTLASIVYRSPPRTIRIASGPPLLLGVVFVAFGWIYPHFVETSHWSGYLIAAPLGLLPCPTLSAIIGLTLIVSGLESVAWSVTLAGAAVLYSAIGVIRLAVVIDIVMFAGAATLIAVVLLRGAKNPALMRTIT